MGFNRRFGGNRHEWPTEALGRADDVIKVNGEKVDKNTIDSLCRDFIDREYYVMGLLIRFWVNV